MKEQALSLVGKSMTKTKGSLRSQCSIIEIHSFNITVLINKRSVSNKGKHRGIKIIVKI